jgi:hypothetical protein
MQGLYNHMSETNHVSDVYSVATILCLRFMLPVMLLPMRNFLHIIIIIIIIVVVTIHLTNL